MKKLHLCGLGASKTFSGQFGLPPSAGFTVQINYLRVKHLEKVTMIEVLATAKALLPAESRSRSIYFLPLAAGNKCLTASAVGKLTSASEADQFGTTM
jgi:hypothetical protein